MHAGRRHSRWERCVVRRLAGLSPVEPGPATDGVPGYARGTVLGRGCVRMVSWSRSTLDEIQAILARLEGEEIVVLQVLGINSLKSFSPMPDALAGDTIESSAVSERHFTVTTTGHEMAIDLQRTGKGGVAAERRAVRDGRGACSPDRAPRARQRGGPRPHRTGQNQTDHGDDLGPGLVRKLGAQKVTAALSAYPEPTELPRGGVMSQQAPDLLVSPISSGLCASRATSASRLRWLNWSTTPFRRRLPKWLSRSVGTRRMPFPRSWWRTTAKA